MGLFDTHTVPVRTPSSIELENIMERRGFGHQGYTFRTIASRQATANRKPPTKPLLNSPSNESPHAES